MAEIIQNPYASRTARWRIQIQEGKHAGNYYVATTKETYALWLLSKREGIMTRKGAKWFMEVDMYNSRIGQLEKQIREVRFYGRFW